MAKLEPASMDDVEALGAGFRANGYWSVKVWSTCGEATVTWVGDRREMDTEEWVGREVRKSVKRRLGEDVESSEDRAVRRARGEVRRYCRHNELNQMVTFTFRGDVPGFDSLSACVQNFWRRWERATGLKRGPYVWVPEWGKVTGRLHIHMAVPWWRELQCVEVCRVCDRYDVLSADDFRVRGNHLCVGCLWGLGFVGRPRDDEGEVETNEDGRSLSRYLSKYMAKDLGSELKRGQQRYRVAEGYQPGWVDEACGSPDEGVSVAKSLMCATLRAEGQTPIMYVPQPRDGWNGPPVVLLDWLVKSPEREEMKCDLESS